MSTSFLVIQAQRDLAIARNNELQALLDYQLAVTFERCSRRQPQRRQADSRRDWHASAAVEVGCDCEQRFSRR